jgi:pSer/pThr/pTyr-binding forkhead associated (FHA) protein
MVQLAMHAGYRLKHTPVIRIIADAQLAPSEVFVHANQLEQHKSATAVMERIQLPAEAALPPQNAQIIVNGKDVFPLTETLINIGRSRENHIVLNDQHISRHHAQLRLRFGSYTLFDTSSQSGTLVNDVQVREHRLQPGDVIQLGRTRLVYLEDPRPADMQTGATTSVDL